jgi:hypothetical protein
MSLEKKTLFFLKDIYIMLSSIVRNQQKKKLFWLHRAYSLFFSFFFFVSKAAEFIEIEKCKVGEFIEKCKAGE